MADDGHDPRHFDETALRRLGAPVRQIEAGAKVFLEHETTAEMYMVHSGRIDIIHYGTVLENVGPGGIFGEMALIDAGERSAAAIAAEPTEVIVVSKADFLRLIRDDPTFALRVMTVLAQRIRQMNQQI